MTNKVVLLPSGEGRMDVSDDEAREIAARRKAERGSKEWSELDTLSYPTSFTAIHDSFAPADGRTFGVIMGQARNVAELRQELIARFGQSYASGAEVWCGLRVPTDVRALVPDHVQRILERIDKKDGNGPESFAFTAQLHVRYV